MEFTREQWRAEEARAEHATKTFTGLFRAYVAREFGPKCWEFDADCCVCKMYRHLEAVCEIVE